MDPLVQVALISGLVAVTVAWISRPTVTSHRRLKRIEAHTEKTGNGFAGHVLDGLKEIKEEQAAQRNILAAQAGLTANIDSRLTRHVNDHTKGDRP